ncbi:MAG: prolyl oligopeptidase family serine peptidase [Anaerolineales bacterium]
MRTSFYITFLFILLTACATPAPPPALNPTPAYFSTRSSLTGEWLGGLTLADGTTQSVVLNFDESNPTLNIEPRTNILPLTLTQEAEVIRFSAKGKWADPFKDIEFTGSLSTGILTGELKWDGETLPIKFIPIASVDTSTLAKYGGVYRFESGRTLSIILGPSFESNGLQFFHNGLTMTDFSNGNSRGLYPLDDFTFAVGALRVVGAPLSGRIQFVTDEHGNATGLTWWDDLDGITPASTPGQIAVRINYSTEDVTFTSADGAVMAGLLTSPETAKPHPAFMMLHGSEPGVKDGFGQQVLAHYMISQGIALLTYDKRGVGDSEGIYREGPDEANINLIASDAVAGADYLSTRPEIDSTKIGLIGGSQAGWVIPVAVAESEQVDFFVIQSGPVLSFAQEDRYSSITNDGDSATTYDAEKLDQSLREMEPSGVNPIPVLTKITKPGLWLWGSVDKNVPFKVSAENLQTLIDSGKKNFSYEILPHGDHNLNETEHGYFAEIPYAPRVLYFSKLTEWLKQNVLQ